jgi:hypothetical protein
MVLSGRLAWGFSPPTTQALAMSASELTFAIAVMEARAGGQ